MKLLYFSDPHFSAIGPISRIDDYQASCFRKIDEIRQIATKESVELILCGGDFFHLKSWMRNPYSMTNKLIDAFNSMPCNILGIFGDHDVPDRNDTSVDKQPLGALCRGSKVSLLTTGVGYSQYPGLFLTGASKADNYEGDRLNYAPYVTCPKGLLHVHLSHGDLWDKPPAYEPYTLYSSLRDSPVDFHWNGHVHDDLGEVRVGKTTIINRGSLLRGSLTEANLNRKVTVTILDVDTRQVKYVELKSALPANKIFDLEKVEETKKAEAEIMRLGELIKHEAGNVELSGPESIRHAVKGLKTIKEPVRHKIFSLLDKAEENV